MLAVLAICAQSDSVDSRATTLHHINFNYSFTPYASKEAWLEKKEKLRKQIVAAAGLLPAPDKPSLDAQFVGKIERDDYVIEKVYFKSLPGFYVAGNLYRPKGKGPFPAIAQPHGHMAKGRLHDDALFSPPRRSIQFARLGWVTFTYDMLGYNDSYQVPHSFFKTAEHEIWGLSHLGLQTWNSIRVVDFLQSLPYVDPSKIACTGESGGGTQTFLLCAVDERVGLCAPVNMISHTMQGGCLCENAGLLRLDTFNVEIGAMMAPRPMIMIAATGDWTKDTPKMEFPSTQAIYKLFGAEDQVTSKQFAAKHNYHKESREAVYGFFEHVWHGKKDAEPVPEPELRKEPDDDLLVWKSADKPKDAVTAEQLFAWWKDNARAQWKHKDVADAYRACLAAEVPKEIEKNPPDGDFMFALRRKGKGDLVKVKFRRPQAPARGAAVLLVHPEGHDVEGLARSLMAARPRFILEAAPFSAARDLKKFSYWSCYNRTDVANRVQDILTAYAYLRHQADAVVDVVGVGPAGLWCLLARPLMPDVRTTVIDAAGFESDSDKAFVSELYVPSLRRVGDLRTAFALSSGSRMFLHNTGEKFSLTGHWAGFGIQTGRASDEEIAAWLGR